MSKGVLVLITGPSGAGKTTLCTKLSTKCPTIDTDDIDDAIALKLLKTKKYLNSSDDVFNKRKDIELSQKLLEAVDKGFQRSNVVVVCGVHTDLVKRSKTKHLDVRRFLLLPKASLDASAELMFQRANLRHLELIVEYHLQLKKLIQSGLKDTAIYNLFCYKYKLRTPFISNLEGTKRRIRGLISSGNPAATPEEIYKLVSRLTRK